MGRSFHQAWHCCVQTSQQLSVDGRLKKAVEVLAMREAQEVVAVTSRKGHRKHDGVQEQIYQLLALQRNSNNAQRYKALLPQTLVTFTATLLKMGILSVLVCFLVQ